MRRRTKAAITAACLVLTVASTEAQAAPRQAGGATAPTRTAGRITDVVVYTDRAQVTRQRPVDCSAGRAVFGGLPSTLDRRTLRATVRGKAVPERGSSSPVVGVTATLEPSGPRTDARKLQAEIRTLDEKLVATHDEIAESRARKKKLQTLRAHMSRTWSRQATGRKPPLASWSSALDLLRREGLAARASRRRAKRERRRLARERARLKRELARIHRKSRRTTLRATVVLSCRGRANVRLSYVVPGATWRMAYRARAEPKQHRLTLVAQAIVQQQTGEDWPRAAIAVSTANLRRRSIPPRLHRMKVRAREPRTAQKVLTRRFERRHHLRSKRADQSRTTGGARPGARPDRALTSLHMQLSAAKRVSVPADGREIVVELARATRRAHFLFEAVPKLLPHVYQRVELTNPFRFTLLPGKVALFSGRSFVAETTIERHAADEPLSFALGIENQLRVRRYVKQEQMKPAGAFGGNKRLLHRYRIQVGNWTKRAQRIRIKENIPVSQNKAIDVSLSAKTTKPSRRDDDDGILTWEMKLAPRSKRVIDLAYTIEVPKSYIVRGYPVVE